MKGANKRKKVPTPSMRMSLERQTQTSPTLDVEEEEEDEESGSGGGDRDEDAGSVASSSKSSRDPTKPRRTSTRNEDKSQGDLDDLFQGASQQAQSHDPNTFVVVPKRRDSRSGGSCEIANEDLYGVSRGKCNECGLCDVYMTAASGLPSCYRILCLYCGCPPAYHEARRSENGAEIIEAPRSNSDIFAGQASSKTGKIRKKNRKRLTKGERKARKVDRKGSKDVLVRDD